MSADESVPDTPRAARLRKRSRKPQTTTASSEETVQKPPPLIKQMSIADFLTLGNAVCGVSSIFLCLNYLENAKFQPYIVAAFVLLPLAVLFDIFDGYVARCTKSGSMYGADLDSLADCVSFGVAPAVLGFTLGLRGIWDSFFLCMNVCCGISRLARYNVTSEEMSAGTGKVKYYEGIPIPFNLLIVIGIMIAYHQGAIGDHVWLGKYFVWIGHFHPISLIYGIFGALMISTVHVPKI